MCLSHIVLFILVVFVISRLGSKFLYSIILLFMFDIGQYLQFLTPILISVVAGGLIGLEREYRDKSAGFRTMILVAVGSTVFTMLSRQIGFPEGESTRIAAAIVSGVGFLGAGAIIKNNNNVGGLTTAAAIWMVASLGMGIGFGQVELSLTAVAVIMVVLLLFPPFERWIDSLHEFTEITILIKNTDEEEDNVLDIFDECNIKIVQIRRSRSDLKNRVLYIKAKMTPAKRKSLSEILAAEPSIIGFDA